MGVQFLLGRGSGARFTAEIMRQATCIEPPARSSARFAILAVPKVLSSRRSALCKCAGCALERNLCVIRESIAKRFFLQPGQMDRDDEHLLPL